MELDELRMRLGRFCRARYEDAQAEVVGLYKLPGHAGFSYGFDVRSGGREEGWVLRLPPPGVAWKGTADVLRQVAILSALDGTPVPHCSVRWSGDDLEWFDRPYFVVPKLDGDVLRMGPGDWGRELAPEQLRDMAEQAMTALAHVHRLPWQRATPTLGPPIPFDRDVTRWDRLVERAADPDLLARAPEVRALLLARLPETAPVGVFHGDFQTSNLFYSRKGELLAVIDWELVGVGATLNDVGWIATFNDPEAWVDAGGIGPSGLLPGPDELVAMYARAYGDPVPPLEWYRALAAYKFSAITGFNLALHRRGKRPDPLWEVIAPSARTLLDRAAELLGA